MIDELDTALRARGVGWRARSRICAEFQDHLMSDPHAQLGSPEELAAEFAEVLGTSHVRTAVIGGWAALVCAALTYAAFVIGMIPHSPGKLQQGVLASKPFLVLGKSGLAGMAASVLLVLLPQIAFASGLLSILHAIRSRTRSTISGRDQVIIRRRMAIALAAAAGSIGSCIAAGILVAGRPFGLSAVLPAVTILMILGASLLLFRAARYRYPGETLHSTLVDDVCWIVPTRLRPNGTTLSGLVAVWAGVIVSLGGAVAGDPYDGALRSVVEAACCYSGYMLLGRYLGIRSSTEEVS